MENINEIRRHIKAVKQTKSLTRAMEVVSSTRMSQIMKHIEYNHRYYDRVQETMKDILMSASGIHNSYIDHRHISHCTYIIMTPDKGMDGAHNSNLLKFAEETIRNRKEKDFSLIIMGETGYQYYQKIGEKVEAHLAGIVQDPTEKWARMIASEIMDKYDSGATDAFRVIYTSFYGKTREQPVVQRILPIRITDFGEIPYSKAISDFEYFPSPQQVFDDLVPQYVTEIVFAFMVQSYASEQFDRMTAMQSANKNADEMLDKYSREYNLVRQSGITNEIAETAGTAVMMSDPDNDQD